MLQNLRRIASEHQAECAWQDATMHRNDERYQRMRVAQEQCQIIWEDLSASKPHEPAYLADGFRVDLRNGVPAIPLELCMHLELLLAGIGP